ncbi:MAG: glycerophosphodiester phosphodiesterase [Clostridiales bacterium]|nr:glycerophosphodiester phosphodiesterase [Clostridiales bacterium]
MIPILSLLLMLFVLFALFYLISPAKPRPGTAPFTHRLFAHRGLYNKEAGIPENSLAAFKRAKEQGFGVELDVRLTKDGQVVVFHDNTLERLCGQKQTVRQTDYATLRTLSLDNTAEKIPLLAEVLQVLDGVPVLCELKIDENYRNMEELCRKTDAVLKQYKGPYCIESFSPFAVRWFMKNRPAVIRGQLSEAFTKPAKQTFVMKHLLVNFLGRPDFISYGTYNTKPLGFRLVKYMGTPTIGWTVRSEQELDQAQKTFDSFIFEGMYNQNT